MADDLARASGAAAPVPSLQEQIDRGRVYPIQLRVVALCALVTLVEGIDLTLIPLLAPAIAQSWSLDSAALGIIFSSSPVGLILGGLGVGYLADRIGRRGALIAAMVLMTVSTIVTAWVVDVPQLLVCRLLAGIAFGGVIPAAVSLVSEFLPLRTRASVVALVILGQAAGALLAAVLLRLPPFAGESWQTLVLYAGLACAAVTLVLVALVPESPRYLALREAGGARLAATLRALRIATVGAVESFTAQRGRLIELFAPGRALGTCLLWATFIGVAWPLSFFTQWLRQIYTVAGQPATAGVDAMAWYSGGAIVGGLLLPLLTRLWHHDKVLIATFVSGFVMTAGLGLALAFSAAVHFTVSFLCGVFVSGAFFMLYPPAVRYYPTDIRSTGVGAAVAFGRVGNTISPLVAGFMLNSGLTPKAVFFAMAAPLLMSCVTLYVFHRRTMPVAAPAVPLARAA